MLKVIRNLVKRVDFTNYVTDSVSVMLAYNCGRKIYRVKKIFSLDIGHILTKCKECIMEMEPVIFK